MPKELVAHEARGIEEGRNGGKARVEEERAAEERRDLADMQKREAKKRERMDARRREAEKRTWR